ncbi:hypothetical protein KGV52_01160 [Candidatus Gracilibacteria bacterium]|nr:hypothetical protein [Candidatus Gracilibacteria bacterium]
MNFKKSYDIYIDEDKVNKSLGFLVVKNSPYIQQMLYNQKTKNGVNYEVHFAELNNSTIYPIMSWFDIFFNLEKNYKYRSKQIFFETRKWNKKIDDKIEVIEKFLLDFKKQYKTSNIVTILDFDTEHKNINIFLFNLLYNLFISYLFFFISSARL